MAESCLIRETWRAAGHGTDGELDADDEPDAEMSLTGADRDADDYLTSCR